MPQVKSVETVIQPVGLYYTQLCDIEAKTIQMKKDDGTEGDSCIWVWKFRGYEKKDKKKEMIPIEIATGSTVSKKDSALKSLLSSAFPDMTLEDMKAYNTDEMIGKSWLVKLGIGDKMNGSQKNVILNLEPLDGEDDPFADE